MIPIRKVTKIFLINEENGNNFLWIVSCNWQNGHIIRQQEQCARAQAAAGTIAEKWRQNPPRPRLRPNSEARLPVLKSKTGCSEMQNSPFCSARKQKPQHSVTQGITRRKAYCNKSLHLRRGQLRMATIPRRSINFSLKLQEYIINSIAMSAKFAIFAK